MQKAHKYLEWVANVVDGPTSLEIANRLIMFNGDKELTESVRHFGLQLVENCIKLKWSELTPESRGQVKSTLENMIRQETFGTGSRLFQEGLSKCVVEAMKHDWPNQWPDLTSTLLSIRLNEKVLLIVGRLSEEIGIFFSPPNRDRRRDMTKEIRNNESKILAYIHDCLTSNNIELCSSALRTLNPFLEWLPWDPDIQTNIENMLTFLCGLLSTPLSDQNLIKPFMYIKQLASECLITCLFRKGAKKERVVLLCLFSENNLESILSCIKATYPLLNATDSCPSLDLLKRLCSVIAMIGQAALSLHAHKAMNQSIWQFYVSTMYSLLAIDNQILNSSIIQFWRELVRYEELLPNVLSEKLIEDILSLVPDKLVKKSFDHPSMGFEFDDDEDYDAFFTKYRAELIDLVRSLTAHSSATCFTFVSRLLETQLQSEYEASVLHRTKWDIVATLLDSVCNKLTNPESFAPQGSRLLSLCIPKCDKFEDLDMVSSQLSCISALTVFLPFTVQTDLTLIDNLLQKIFFLSNFERAGESKLNRSGDVRDIRRHAAAFFIKLTRTQSSFFFPLFNQLHDLINRQFSDHTHCTQTEMLLMKEGLLILSNHFEDINTQRLFIEELIHPINWFLVSPMKIETLIPFIGLNLPPSDEDDALAQNRGRLAMVVGTLAALLNRISRKEAVIDYLKPFLLPVCQLIHSLNILWHENNQKLCHVDFRPKVFAPISESERAIILDSHLASSPNNGSGEPKKENHLKKTAVDRMVTYIQNLHENCLTVMGNACNSFKPEIFLEFNGFLTPFIDPSTTVESIGTFLPDLKLRNIARSYVKPFIHNFPREDMALLESKFLPVIDYFLRNFFNRVDAKCEEIRLIRQADHDKTEPESEILGEKVCRLLCIEFLETFHQLLIKPSRSSTRRSSKQGAKSMGEDDWDMADDGDKPDSNANTVSLSEIGDFLLKHRPSEIVIMAFHCLRWLDSDLSLKAAHICQIILEKMIADQTINDRNQVEFLFNNILPALEYFGQHETNEHAYLTCLIQIYENVVVPHSFFEFREYFAKKCNCDTMKWIELENSFFKKGATQQPAMPTKPSAIRQLDRQKREALKHLLDPLIAKNISSQFKNKVEYGSSRLPMIPGLIRNRLSFQRNF